MLSFSQTTGDFHLQVSSLAIDTGAPYGLQLGYEGNPVLQGTPIPPTGPRVDIGAYEYGNTLACEGFDDPSAPSEKCKMQGPERHELPAPGLSL